MALANDIVLEYDGFYDRLEEAAEPEYEGVDIGFYLIDQQGSPCRISEAHMLDRDRQTYPLDVSAVGRILMPTDKLLDQKKARLFLTQEDKQQNCQLSMLLLAAEPQQQYSAEQLTSLHQTMAELFDDLGGMFSFMLPSVSGLTFWFEQDVMIDGLLCQAKKCSLEASNIPGKGLSLPVMPARVTPMISKKD